MVGVVLAVGDQPDGAEVPPSKLLNDLEASLVELLAKLHGMISIFLVILKVLCITAILIRVSS